jgi:hypothetical protein
MPSPTSPSTQCRAQLTCGDRRPHRDLLMGYLRDMACAPEPLGDLDGVAAVSRVLRAIRDRTYYEGRSFGDRHTAETRHARERDLRSQADVRGALCRSRLAAQRWIILVRCLSCSPCEPIMPRRSWPSKRRIAATSRLRSPTAATNTSSTSPSGTTPCLPSRRPARRVLRAPRRGRISAWPVQPEVRAGRCRGAGLPRRAACRRPRRCDRDRGEATWPGFEVRLSPACGRAATSGSSDLTSDHPLAM